jgi:hypothetical protein
MMPKVRRRAPSRAIWAGSLPAVLLSTDSGEDAAVSVDIFSAIGKALAKLSILPARRFLV